MATSAAASNRNPSLCLGCGEVVNRSSERRNLTSATSQHVVPLWKTVMESELRLRRYAADLDSVISGVHGSGPGYMCRKCFYAYEKVLKAKAAIEANVAKAFNAIAPMNLTSPIGSVSSTTPKRSSPNTTAFPPPKRRPQHSLLSSSPTVGKEPSPRVSIHVGYKKPQTYELTPSRKHIGKAVARGRRQSVAIECLKEHSTRRHLLKKIGMLVRNELIVLCSDSFNSILRQQSVSELKGFTWKKLLSELENKAPIFLTILRECTHTRRPRSNQDAVMGMCAALLLKHRFSKMSLVQKIMSLVLYGGHSGKQVYERLQKVNVTMSHQVTVRLLTKLGKGHDESVKIWQESLTTSLSTKLQQEHNETTRSLPGNTVISPGDLSSESSGSETDSDSIAAVLQTELQTEPHNLWMLTDLERKEVLNRITEKIVDSFIHFQFHTDVHKSNDHVHEYGKQLLSLGCFYLEYSDAIREGDGDRVLLCWKYLLAIFKSSGRKNYSIEALNMLYQYEYELTPRQSAELLWNRYINIHGIQGRNIPCDLHLEHLNRICKNAISDLGVNKTETAIIRAGNALGTLSPVLQQYDLDNHVRDTCGMHHAPKSDKDRDQIIFQLQQSDIFSSLESRAHQTFPRPRDVLHDFNHDKLCQWITEHIT